MTVARYGSWKSPITADLLVAKSVSLGQPSADGDDLYWLEGRPTEGGRAVLVRRTPDGSFHDVTPAPFNVRSRVHEYGGGAYLVDDGTVFFVNFGDQRVYRQDPEAEPRPIAGTPLEEGNRPALRYADFIHDLTRDRLIAVREDHTGPGQPVNTIVALDLARAASEAPPAGGAVAAPGSAATALQPGEILVSGRDFYSTPRLSPDESRLAWLAWDHPNMPWDGTELWVGELDVSGGIAHAELVAGGKEESIFQPEWSPDGSLYFVSDRSGWWNIYRLGSSGEAVAICPIDSDFGVPQWQFGARTYCFDTARRIYCSYRDQEGWRLGRLDTATYDFSPLETSFSEFGGPVVLDGKVYFRGGSPTRPYAIVARDLATGRIEVVRQSCAVPVDPAYLSVPDEITFPARDGQESHAIFYRPKNPDFQVPADELPPLIVMSHGGPTGAASTVLNLSVQYWTSRGFAVADVDYGGSTGYGRAYRERLKGKWGIVDVDDCCDVVGYLAELGQVDPKRAVIEGGSAGGYTTLAALTFRDVFSAGASLFGVSDPEVCARETHKFESRYLDGLIGPYPEAVGIYTERAPIHHVDQLSCPIIFFQGLDDKIVPPNQSEMMADALRKKGIPVAYLAFEGEGHGFVRAENIKRTIEAQLYFYCRIFGIKPADDIQPVKIDNL